MPKVTGLQPCGTSAAAQRHRRRGEPPCAVCAEAERAYERERNRPGSEARQRRGERYLESEGPRRKAERDARRKPLKRDLPCLEEHCGQLVGPNGSKGRCQRCNQRIARAKLRAEQRPCARSRCPKFVRAVGQPFCDMHRSRVRRYGDPGPAGQFNRPAGEWGVNKNGYRSRVINGRGVLEHRLVMEQLLGRKLKRSETVHHVNGQRADNKTDGPLVDFRSGNLELWSSWQPSGQRVVDKIKFATELLREYAPELLAALDSLPAAA